MSPNATVPFPTAVVPDIDLFAEIDRLKRETDTVLLAHYYQEDVALSRSAMPASFLPASTSWPRPPKSLTPVRPC
jgi:hypothetical protein